MHPRSQIPNAPSDICITYSVCIDKKLDYYFTETPLYLQDFFQFACGGWIANNEIPEGKSRWGKFYELRDKVDKAVRSK